MMGARPGWALLLLLLLSGVAQAGQLTGVRAFTAPGHARVLLVLEGVEAGAELSLSSRASPPMAGIEARAVAIVEGLSAGPDLPELLPVGSDGLLRVRVSVLGTGTQITLELGEARQVRVERIHARGLLIDATVGEPPPEVGLAVPTRAQLVAFLEGASLSRGVAAAQSRRPIVALDAGHGGYDHGAVGVSGTREADVALQLVKLTALQMRRELDVEVLLTRERDEFVGLSKRARIANEAGADLFISIHANAAPGPAAWGIETYSMDTASDAGAARVEARENAIAREEGLLEGDDMLAARLITEGTMRLSKELAGHVQAGVCRHLGALYGSANIRDLGTKTALFTVLTRTRMPAILFESSFVSNPADERRLRAAHFQQSMAEAIVDSVDAWLDRQGAQPQASR